MQRNIYIQYSKRSCIIERVLQIIENQKKIFAQKTFIGEKSLKSLKFRVPYSILFYRVNTYFESILSYTMSNLELPIIHLDSSTEEERRTEAIHLLEAFQRSSFFSTQVGKNGCLIDWSLFFDDLWNWANRRWSRDHPLFPLPASFVHNISPVSHYEHDILMLYIFCNNSW